MNATSSSSSPMRMRTKSRRRGTEPSGGVRCRYSLSGRPGSGAGSGGVPSSGGGYGSGTCAGWGGLPSSGGGYGPDGSFGVTITVSYTGRRSRRILSSAPSPTLPGDHLVERCQYRDVVGKSAYFGFAGVVRRGQAAVVLGAESDRAALRVATYELVVKLRGVALDDVRRCPLDKALNHLQIAGFWLTDQSRFR